MLSKIQNFIRKRNETTYNGIIKDDIIYDFCRNHCLSRLRDDYSNEDYALLKLKAYNEFKIQEEQRKRLNIKRLHEL